MIEQQAVLKVTFDIELWAARCDLCQPVDASLPTIHQGALIAQHALHVFGRAALVANAALCFLQLRLGIQKRRPAHKRRELLVHSGIEAPSPLSGLCGWATVGRILELPAANDRLLRHHFHALNSNLRIILWRHARSVKREEQGRPQVEQLTATIEDRSGGATLLQDLGPRAGGAPLRLLVDNDAANQTLPHRVVRHRLAISVNLADIGQGLPLATPYWLVAHGSNGRKLLRAHQHLLERETPIAVGLMVRQLDQGAV